MTPALLETICASCKEAVVYSADPHLIEAWEISGKFLCEACWDELAETLED